MRAAEEAAFARGVEVEALMDKARGGGTNLDIILVELFAEAAEELSAAQEALAAEAYIASAAPLIILDGLLGMGAKPPLRDPIRTACRSINQLRAAKGAYVFAVDLPTGLDGDSGKADRDCVVADFTVTIGFAKPGLLADDALNFVGRLEVVHLDELRSPEKKAKEVVAAPPVLSELLPRRKFG